MIRAWQEYAPEHSQQLQSAMQIPSPPCCLLAFTLSPSPSVSGRWRGRQPAASVPITRRATPMAPTHTPRGHLRFPGIAWKIWKNRCRCLSTRRNCRACQLPTFPPPSAKHRHRSRELLVLLQISWHGCHRPTRPSRQQQQHHHQHRRRRHRSEFLLLTMPPTYTRTPMLQIGRAHV